MYEPNDWMKVVGTCGGRSGVVRSGRGGSSCLSRQVHHHAVGGGEERDELRVRERQRLRSDLGAAVVRLAHLLEVLLESHLKPLAQQPLPRERRHAHLHPAEDGERPPPRLKQRVLLLRREEVVAECREVLREADVLHHQREEDAAVPPELVDVGLELAVARPQPAGEEQPAHERARRVAQRAHPASRLPEARVRGVRLEHEEEREAVADHRPVEVGEAVDAPVGPHLICDVVPFAEDRADDRPHHHVATEDRRAVHLEEVEPPAVLERLHHVHVRRAVLLRAEHLREPGALRERLLPPKVAPLDLPLFLHVGDPLPPVLGAPARGLLHVGRLRRIAAALLARGWLCGRAASNSRSENEEDRARLESSYARKTASCGEGCRERVMPITYSRNRGE